MAQIALQRHTSRLLMLNSHPPTLSLDGLLVSGGFALWMIKPVGDIRLVLVGYILVLTGSCLQALVSGLWIDKRIFLYWLSSITVGIFSMLLGLNNGNPGVYSEMVFFVILPIVWLVLSLGIRSSTIRFLINLMPLMGLIIGVLGVLYWIDATGRGRVPSVILLDLGQGLGIEEFGYGLRFYPISTLVFLLPFLIMSLAVRTTYTWGVSKVLAYPASLVTLGLLLVAGRRVLFVSLVLSLCVGLFLVPRALGFDASRAKARLAQVLILTLIASVFMSIVTDFSFMRLVQSLLNEWHDPKNARSQAAADLIQSWSTSPIFGHGLGATLSGPPRSIERPWNFEVQYHLILNAVGLLGLIALAYITVNMLLRTTRTARSHPETFGFLFPVLVGSIALLIANATNPYMHTPGHYWMLYILVISANAIHRDIQKSEQAVDAVKAKERLQEGHLQRTANTAGYHRINQVPS